MSPGPWREEMPGLAAGPMGNWLAAVGALRMESRLDPGAALYWAGRIPVIVSSRRSVVRDLADRAAFTPVITPWQAGGGWGPDDRDPAEQLSALRNSRTPRLAGMRAAIAKADSVMRRHAGLGKAALVLRLRNELPDDALPWLDAVVPLRENDGNPELTIASAPIAGAGGSDARWDISASFHAAVLAVDPEAEPRPDGATDNPAVARRRGLLHDLLEGTRHESLADGSTGPYWGDASAAGLVNPWALILLAEGLCAFGDQPLRVSGERRQPWTTAPGPELAADDSPGEAWLPMWDAPAPMPEVARLLGGPQPAWRGQAAQAPAGMYASLAAGGWPRGVSGYARYGLARRRGQGHVAVPLDIVTPQTADPDWLTTEQAAAAAGVGAGTWKGYVSRGQAPQHDKRDPRTGRPLWLASTIERYLATRPGQGTRTDL